MNKINYNKLSYSMI